MPAQTTGDAESKISKPEEVLTRLLDQPTEVVGEALQWLDLKDLLTLRITNRRLHYLVHDHEKSICARFVTRLQRQHSALQLPNKISGLTNDLLFYIELQRRYSAIQDLSMLLSQHVISRIKMRHPVPEKAVDLEWRERKVSRLQQQLFPALFLFNNFLECLHTVYLSGEEAFATWNDELLLSLHDVYDLDQQRIIEDFSPCNEETIRNVTAASAVVLGVAKSRRLSLSSKGLKYPFASLKRVLVSTGLLSLSKILIPGTSDMERRNNLIQVNATVWASKGRRPVEYYGIRLQSIHHLKTERVQYLGKPPKNRSYGTKQWFVDRQDVWTKAAFAVYQRLGSTDSFPPDTDAWIRHGIAEAYDPVYDLSDWTTPDPT